MRTILHSDLNNFFASVEIAKDKTLEGKFIAVCGNTEERHGIVLAKNDKAKALGVKTGMTIWEAKKICPMLIPVEMDMDSYMEYSLRVRKIYADYTDRIESFGIDESWLDVSGSKIFGSGIEIAEKIRERVKKEIGLTVSIGVSFNKVFAKLGSDMKKPDAVTVIDENNFREKVWRLPVSELLYVGKSTTKKLNQLNIKTIGELAKTDKEYLIKELGKWGETLYVSANGLDETPVINGETENTIKSVGNSMTTYRDLENIEDIKLVFYFLADSVIMRIVKANLSKPKTITIYVRDDKLISFSRQITLNKPTILINKICEVATELFSTNYVWQNSVRTLGLSLSNFCEDDEQTNIFEDTSEQIKNEQAEKCVADIKLKYDREIINKGIAFTDKKLLTKKLAEKPIFK